MRGKKERARSVLAVVPHSLPNTLFYCISSKMQKKQRKLYVVHLLHLQQAAIIRKEFQANVRTASMMIFSHTNHIISMTYHLGSFLHGFLVPFLYSPLPLPLPCSWLSTLYGKKPSCSVFTGHLLHCHHGPQWDLRSVS